MAESTRQTEKRAGFPRIIEAQSARSGLQKETLMSPEIAVGCGMSFSPMELCQS